MLDKINWLEVNVNDKLDEVSKRSRDIQVKVTSEVVNVARLLGMLQDMCSNAIDFIDVKRKEFRAKEGKVSSAEIINEFEKMTNEAVSCFSTFQYSAAEIRNKLVSLEQEIYWQVGGE